MLDRLLNNRKEWNALKEVHEAKMAALEEARKAREEAAGKAAAAKQGRDPGPPGGLQPEGLWPEDPNFFSCFLTSSLLSPPPPSSCSQRCSVTVQDLCCELETLQQDRPPGEGPARVDVLVSLSSF